MCGRWRRGRNIAGDIPLEAEYLEPAEPTQGSSTSSVLRDAQERYPMMQKLLLAILIASRKMRPYFESHPITLVSYYMAFFMIFSS